MPESEIKPESEIMPESKIKKRNIVLCSDGTGNQGGTTPDSNVFKIYNAVKINSQKNETEQITFYDNGVGTSKISIMKALGGGMYSGPRNWDSWLR